jgi:hypothetical protein
MNSFFSCIFFSLLFCVDGRAGGGHSSGFMDILSPGFLNIGSRNTGANVLFNGQNPGSNVYAPGNSGWYLANDGNWYYGRK